MTKTFARLFLLPITAIALSMPAAPASAAAPDWSVNSAASRLTFSGTHAGDPFEGRFGKWDARIAFDPKQLGSSRIIVVIATGSAATGDEVQENALKNGEWFDPAGHPTATFASSDIRARGGNRYVANGTLTIKGKRVPVSLPFTVTINGRSARAQGSLTLDRIALGLGLSSDSQAEWVSRNIDLGFSLTATR